MPPMKMARFALPEPGPLGLAGLSKQPARESSWSDVPALAGALGGTPAAPSTAEPAWPDKAAQVRLGGEPGRFLAALWVYFHGRGRIDVEAAWTRRTGMVDITFNGVPAAYGTWKRGEIVDVAMVAPAQMMPVDLEGPLLEIGMALLAGERDPALVEAAAEVVPYAGNGTLDEALARGDANEERGLALVKAAVDGLGWIQRVRKARLDEDRRGIDVVVETKDAGELYVQIKSSERGARTWTEKYRTRPMFVRSLLVIFEPGHASTKLANVTAGLVRLHGKFVVRPMSARATDPARTPLASAALPHVPLLPPREPGGVEPLRVLTFPSYPNAILVQLPEGSTATLPLPPLTAPFTRTGIITSFRAAGLPVAVSDSVPGRWSQALMQARSAEKAERTNRQKQREINEAMILRGASEPEQRERSRVMLAKHAVDEEIVQLKAKIREAKVTRFERGIYLAPGEFHRLENRLDQKQLESQSLLYELVRLRDAERQKDREVERGGFLARFFDAAKSSLPAEAMAKLTAMADEGDDELDDEDESTDD